MTVADDVILQVAFNSAEVKAQRLIGYENRLLLEEDFLEYLQDAGELGAGVSATALFELIPADESESIPTPIVGSVPEILGFGGAPEAGSAASGSISSGVAEVRVRYKRSGEDALEQRQVRVLLDDRRNTPTMKFRFASNIGQFAMSLRGSQYIGDYDSADLIAGLKSALPLDKEGAVSEAIEFATAAHAFTK